MFVNDIFTDFNECDLGLDSCDENSDCINTEGSYECRCHDGYTGNGTLCTGQVLGGKLLV